MKFLLVPVFLFALGMPGMAQESVYTKLDLDKDCVFHSEYLLDFQDTATTNSTPQGIFDRRRICVLACALD